MGRERSLAEESIGVVIYYSSHLVGVTAVLWYYLQPRNRSELFILSSSSMGRERSPAEESIGVVIYYSSHLVGVTAVLCALHLVGITLEIYLGGYVSPFVEFLKAKESSLGLVLVLGIALGAYLGGHSTLGEFLKEKMRRRIAGKDGNDCLVLLNGESSNRSQSQAGIWFMDSGAQCHATGDLRLFSGHLNMTKQGSWIYGVSGHEHRLPIRGLGTVQFAHFRLEQVYYVEGLGRNLICLSKFLETFGYSIRFGKATYIEEEATGNRICEIRTVGRLYEIDSVAVALDPTPAADGRA